MDQGSSFGSSRPEKRLKLSPEALPVLRLNDSLFQLYKPLEKPNVQLVFFHGFQRGEYEDAHLSTWKAGDGSCVWPQTWLAEKYPSAHILSVSYIAHLTKSRTRADVDLFIIGENLLCDLLKANIGKDPRCPLILVGHSFGGLVIKEICARAHAKSSDEHINFLKSVEGIFFYSTPHYGIPFGFTSCFLSKSNLWKDVEILSTSTARLNDNFENLRKLNGDWQIAGVGESVPVQWDKVGKLIVEEASSRYGSDFCIVGGADHISISKPMEKTSTGFNTLTALIQRVFSTARVAGSVHRCPGLPKCPSGLQQRATHVKEMLKQATVLGIVGMGGIGKTTIAKEVFNDISSEFEYTCFVENVKGRQATGDWLLDHFFQNGTRSDGKKMQWSNLKGKKTLIIMDDVDSQDQLKNLPESNHFGNGSCLVITSRDEDVLAFYPEHAKYPVEFLNSEEAKKLLCKHAFDSDKNPNPRLTEMVNGVVKKCQGLPLSLELVGRYIRPHNNEVRFWEETTRRLGKAKSITGKKKDRLWASLRISYDALSQEEKQMFMEVGTCFFEKPVEEAIAAWSIDNENALTTWDNLLQTSMVKAVPKRKEWRRNGRYTAIWVHEHLRDFAKTELMGRKIHLFDTEDYGEMSLPNAIAVEARIDDQKRVTKLAGMAIEPLLSPHTTRIEFRRNLQILRLNGMERLKYLDLHDILPRGNFPSSLILLKLNSEHYRYKSQGRLLSMNSDELENLAVLQLGNIKLPKTFPVALGNLINLRIVSLCDLGLDHLPENFGNLRRLEKLELIQLYKLSMLPDSFGNLSALKYLEISSLRIVNLPESFGRLCALEELLLEGCDKLQRLPESFGQLRALKKLTFQNACVLQALCDSFGLLFSLEELVLKSCWRLQSFPDSFGQLGVLKKLTIKDAPVLEALCDSFRLLFSLEELVLECCPRLQSLPDSFGLLRALKKLTIENAVVLDALCDSFGLLSVLEELVLDGCTKLQRLPANFGQLTALKILKISGAIHLVALPDCFGELSELTTLELHCPRLKRLPDSFGLLSALEELVLDYCRQLQRLPDNFVQLRGLQQLHVKGADRLEALSDNFGELRALTSLMLRGCPRLKNLPESFGLLSALEKLVLEGCDQLRRLPDNFGELTALRELHMTGADCLLSDNFGELSALRILELGCRRLITLPDSFGLLSALEELVLERCSRLQQLPENFGRLRALRQLNIQGAYWLKALSDNFGELSALTSLRLDCPRLERFPDSFGLLSALEKLALEGCTQLQILPDNFSQLTTLQDLEIVGADVLVACPLDRICRISSRIAVNLFNCRELRSVSHNLRESSSPQLLLAQGDRNTQLMKSVEGLSKVPVDNEVSLVVERCPFLDDEVLGRSGWVYQGCLGVKYYGGSLAHLYARKMG